MASRLIHYTVANIIKSIIPVKDENSFLVGAIIPDAWHLAGDNNKNKSHFFETFKETRGSNCQRFIQEYCTQDNCSDFFWGYFLHLLMDNIYLCDIQSKYLYSYPKITRSEILSYIYNDNLNFNLSLCKKYHLTLNLENIDIENFKEMDLSIDLQNCFFDEFKKDFIDGNCEPLIWLQSTDLYNYIYKTVEIGSSYIIKLRNNPDVNLDWYYLSNSIR